MAYIQSYVLTRAMADFPAHISWAEQIKKSMNMPFYVILKQAGDAHAGWQVLLLLFNTLFGLPFQAANLAAVVLCEVATIFLLLRWFWPTIHAKYPAIWKQAGIMGGFALPTLFVLTGQYLITYAGNSGGILFAPFTVMNHYSGFLLPKFLLSVPFPLLVATIYRRRVWREAYMSLAWLIFLFGCFYTYFLAEGGLRLYDGNFGWSGEIGLFVLFAASTLFFLGTPESSDKSRRFLRLVWFCHVIIGAIYHGYFLVTHVYA